MTIFYYFLYKMDFNNTGKPISGRPKRNGDEHYQNVRDYFANASKLYPHIRLERMCFHEECEYELKWLVRNNGYFSCKECNL